MTRIFLHVGAPKTGTSYLQAVLFHNQQRLSEAGILVPGRGRRDHGRAATGVWQGPRTKRLPAWRRIVAEAKAWPRTVVISNEWFGISGADRAHWALEHFAGIETHIICTARDFVDQVPAAWQETLKLGISSTLDDFVTSLEGESGRWRWSVLDPAVVLERWRADLPADRVHVVTVPPRGSDPGLLWERFAAVCGIDPAGCETRLDRKRESLSAESARLLQLMGPQLREAIGADGGHWMEPFRWIQECIAHDLLVPQRGSRISMRPSDAEAVRARSKVTVDTLGQAGYDVVGDLSDLISTDAFSAGRHPDDITDRELIAVAIPVVAGLLRRIRSEAIRAQDAGDLNPSSEVP